MFFVEFNCDCQYIPNTKGSCKSRAYMSVVNVFVPWLTFEAETCTILTMDNYTLKQRIKVIQTYHENSRCYRKFVHF